MKAVSFTQFQGELNVADLPDPAPANDGVVVRVNATGICRSDWHAWQGHDPTITVFPHVGGHELAGEIVAVGSDVKKWRMGQRVTVPFAAGCGRCEECGVGDTHVCRDQYQPGFSGWGSFAELVALRYADTNLIEIPESVSDIAAASLGCRLSTAYRAVVHQGRLRPGQSLVIFGAGGVGLSALMVAKTMDAAVTVVDVRDDALELAKSFGADQVLNVSDIKDVPSAIVELTSGGANVTIDAYGNARTASDAVLSLRPRGRHVQVGLLTGRDILARMPMARVIAWELEILGSHGLHVGGFRELLELVSSGVLDPTRLVSRQVSLEETPAVLRAMTNFQEVGIVMMKR